MARTIMVGFAVLIEWGEEAVIVYGIKKGLVRCPKSCFEEGLWFSGALGQWYMVEAVEWKGKGSPCKWKALSVRKLPQWEEPPVQIWKDDSLKQPCTEWHCKTRVIVGAIHRGKEGVGWSPDVGRVLIPVSGYNLKPMQEMDAEVHLNLLSELSWDEGPGSGSGDWVLRRIVEVSGPLRLVLECPEVWIFPRARVSTLDPHNFSGKLQEIKGERGRCGETISFLYSDVSEGSEGNPAPRLTEGSEWKVLAHGDPSHHYSESKTMTWIAIALLPLNYDINGEDICIDVGECGWEGDGEEDSLSPILTLEDFSERKEAAKKGVERVDMASQTDETEESRLRHSREVEVGMKRMGLLEEEMVKMRVHFQDSLHQRDALAEELSHLRDEFSQRQQAAHLQLEEAGKLVEKYKREAMEALNELERLGQSERERGGVEREREREGVKNVIGLQAANQRLEARVKELKGNANKDETPARKNMVDVGSQVEGEEAKDLLQKIFRDQEVFSFICQKSPDLVRDFFKATHTLKLTVEDK